MAEIPVAQELREAAQDLRQHAPHILRPGFYIALAEWLEAEAHMAGHRGNSTEGHTFHALKVARACLGTEGKSDG